MILTRLPCGAAALASWHPRGRDDGSAMLDRNGRCWRPLDAGTIMGQLWGHNTDTPSR